MGLVGSHAPRPCDAANDPDHVFGGEGCRQEQLYQSTVSPVIHLAMEGYNGLVFAYGESGAA